MDHCHWLFDARPDGGFLTTMSTRSSTRWSMVVAATAIMSTVSARASSVVRMPLPTLADYAGQVVVGTVTSADASWSEANHRVETELVLTGVAYLKGRPADSSGTLRLVIPGGTLAGQRMQICCAPMPRVGQKWLLFLLPSYHTFPVVGLYQGAFRIQTISDGVERVYREDHGRLRGVTGVDQAGFMQLQTLPARSAREKLVGADRMRLIETARQPAAASAMPLADFRSLIAPVLAASRQYTLTQPIGTFVPVARTPVRLRQSATAKPPARGGNPVIRSSRVQPATLPRWPASGGSPR